MAAFLKSLKGPKKEEDQPVAKGSVRRPDSLTNLESYEGMMVGMNISDNPKKSLGLASALTDKRGSGQLASTMLGMQSEFMDELGFQEDPVARKVPSDEREEPGWRKSLSSNWSKVALGFLTLCGLLAISVLVLHIEGSNLEQKRLGELSQRDAMQQQTTHLQDSMTHQDLGSKCPKYEDLFLQWLTAFCKLANCTSELCHKSWIHFEGNCYYFSKTMLDWEKSRQDCISQGSELLVLRSQREQKFVASFDPQSEYWIGIKEEAEYRTWLWVDGSPLQDDLMFWDRDYPDSYFDYELEDFKDCGVLRNKTWANAACAKTHRWICKRRSEKLPVTL